MGLSRQECWNGLPFPSPVDHVLLELSTMTHPSWVALHSMAHSFLELDKAVIHVIHYSDNKGLYSQRYGFSSSHVWMWELDHKEGWVPKNWCFWTVLLEKTLESPLYCKEIRQVNPKENQSWIFTETIDAEAEAPILWPLDVKNWLIGKDPDARKYWRQEEKGMIEDEMAGWHRWLDGRKFGWTPGVGDRQGGLMCYDSWGYKSRTRLSNWTELRLTIYLLG